MNAFKDAELILCNLQYLPFIKLLSNPNISLTASTKVISNSWNLMSFNKSLRTGATRFSSDFLLSYGFPHTIQCILGLIPILNLGLIYSLAEGYILLYIS